MPKINSKNRKKKRIKKYKIIVIIVIIIAIIVMIKNNKEKEYNIFNNKSQIILDNENITNNLQNNLIFDDGKIYLSVEDIKKYFDESIYKEDSTNTLITIGNNKVVALKENSNIVLVNGSTIQENNVLINKEGIDYLSISYLATIYNYDINYITETNIIVLNSLNKKSEKARTRKKTKLKEQRKFFSKTIITIPKDEEIYVVFEEGGFAKVRTNDGLMGYIKLKELENKVVEREDFIIENKNLSNENIKEVDITNEDISTFDKREKVINQLLQDSVKNSNLNIKIIYLGENSLEFERFKKESVPVLSECGITISF